ncbi:MAG: hypothetical protein V4507_04110 [Verrucomicrobiota bacterium]
MNRKIKNPIGSIKNKRRSGVALLMSLSFIVFLTLLMMAFFSRALLQRKISSASTAITKTDMMAKSCLDLIVGDLKSEIYAGSAVYGKNGLNDKTEPFLYLPMYNTNVVVQRSGVTGKNVDQANLVKISGSQPSFSLNGQQGRIVGSEIGTDEVSLYGQKISRDQWKNGPLLVKEMEKAPSWVTLTRSGVQTDWKADFSNKKSADYVVGRFAYAIYDVSGLLDMNVAGYPKDLVTDSGTVNTKMLRQKGGLEWSSLDALGSSTYPFSASHGQNLVKWRLKKTSTDASFYTNYIYGFGATNGFMKVLEGDNQLLGRREMIRMAKKEGFQEALPLMTSFTREKNAPSFLFPAVVPTGESSNYPVEGRLAKNTTSPEYPNKNWFGYRFTKEGRSPESTPQITWSPGDPLILRRFSLDRLSWLTFKGPSGLLPAGDPLYKAEGTVENIRYYFGLSWDSSVDEWVYCGAGSTPQDSIKTLANVISENREPNFFELLKAFIHTDVLGLDSTNGTGGSRWGISQNHYLFDRLADYQILRIGACMIDQSDSDRYPTIISYRPTVTGFGSTDLKVHGVENLPYLAKLSLMALNPYWPNDCPGEPIANLQACDFSGRILNFYAIPELHSPHLTNSVTSNGPSDIRLNFNGRISIKNLGSNVIYPFNFDQNSGFITIPSAGFNDYFPTPRRIRSSSGIAGMTQGTGTGIFQNIQNTLGTLDYKVFGGLYGTTAGVAPANTAKHDDYGGTGSVTQQYVGPGSNGFDMILRYKNYKGNYKVYNVFCGTDSSNASLNLSTGLGNSSTVGNFFNTFLRNDFNMLPTTLTLAAANFANSSTYRQTSTVYLRSAKYRPDADFFKPDVRTSRLEIGFFYGSELRTELSMRPVPTAPMIIAPTSLLPSLPSAPNYAGTYTDQGVLGSGAFDQISGNAYSGAAKGRGWVAAFNNNSPTLKWGLSTGANSQRRLDTSLLVFNATIQPQWMPCMLSENRKTENISDTFYYDHGPDGNYNTGRVRPADSAIIGRYTGVNNPTLASQRSIYNNFNAMPVILDRPFKSVGELGNVFMDLPYRSLDFFSSESVNAGLLDVFTVAPPASSQVAVIAGSVNPNSSHAEVLATVLAETGRNEKGDRFISSQEATTIAKDIGVISSGGGGVFQNRADLVTRASAYKVGSSSDAATQVTVSAYEDANDSTPYPTIKTEREAPIRALAPVSNTRTWNLLIDMVVQSGRYPTTAAKLQDFTVEGQRRCWMHVAIDRYTGEVVDQQIEWIQ